jgi:RNA polymerase sigma-70 factor (ECF subfamily)
LTAQVITLRPDTAESATLSDEAVALACASADPAAVTELFRRFHEPVARYLSRLVHDPADVEDLVQATFLEVARGHAQYGSRAKVRTWLFGIATNLARVFWRSARRRVRLVRELTLVEAHTAGHGIPSAMDSQSQIALARRALEALPEGQREAFVLCEIEGLTAKEAAEVLTISEAAVWKRVSYARSTILRYVSGVHR